MCRREEWDRDYETIVIQTERGLYLNELEQQRVEEEKARAAWDAEYLVQKRATQSFKLPSK